MLDITVMTLCIMMDIYCVFVQNKECRMPKLHQNVTYGLWVIMMYQCKFINCNKSSTLMEEVHIEEAVHVGGIGSIWEISVPSV